MRHPAAKGKADSNQPAIKAAIELLIYPLPVMVLSAAGNGVEDLLVPLTRPRRLALTGKTTGGDHYWLLVECKVEHPSYGKINPVRYTQAQKEWRAQTEGWPRITVTSGQDAVDRIRELTR